jgi:ABC-type sugar transport system ATPase subunit
MRRRLKRKQFAEERIIAVLKEHEARMKTGGLARMRGILRAAPYDWKAKFAGMSVSEARRLRLLNIRPEIIELASERGLAAKLRVAEPAGAGTMITADLAGQTKVGLMHRRLSVQPGGDIALGATAGFARFFDATSQRKPESKRLQGGLVP